MVLPLGKVKVDPWVPVVAGYSLYPETSTTLLEEFWSTTYSSLSVLGTFPSYKISEMRTVSPLGATLLVEAFGGAVVPLLEAASLEEAFGGAAVLDAATESDPILSRSSLCGGRFEEETKTFDADETDDVETYSWIPGTTGTSTVTGGPTVKALEL